MHDLRQTLGRSPRAAGGSDGAWRDRLAGRPADAQHELMLDFVTGQVAAVAGTGAGVVDRGAPWRALGVYRHIAERLRAALAEQTGLRLPATLFFDRPTPHALADHLRRELLGIGDEITAVSPTAGPAAGGAAAGGGFRPADDPIVIVGMGCRLAGGVDSPEALWELVHAGRDAVAGLPEDRGWDLAGLYHPDPDHPGTAYTRHGGFLRGIDQFDPAFFGIGPREAGALDPQQRLMLEVSWEALERAGIDPRSLRGSRTGVFTGVSLQDYGPAWHTAPPDAQGQLLTGNASGVIAGRVAYTFGLEGLALSVDTQCSASLVATHLASQALRAGECDLALVGGVTVMSTPGILVEFSRKRGLAPDGRCKAFSADADGTGWADGAGVLLLERLSDARRRGHRVHAVLRGTAINQDGASNGLTAPNGLSQQRLIRQALANAGLRTADVDAVEAHGTGTTLGDPIEAQAVLATYGQDRPAGRPLYLGSLKSNIGHAQAAAGVCGIIKMVQALRHEVLPRTLHVREPSPHVDWSAGDVELLTDNVPWARREGRPRRAGVSAFGVSGTNAHIIIEEAPAEPRPPAPRSGTADHPGTIPQPAAVMSPARPPAAPTAQGGAQAGAPVPIVLSGRTPAALRAQAEQLATYLERHPDLDPVDVAHTLAGRTSFEHRAVALAGRRRGGDGVRRLAGTLSAFAAGRPAAGIVLGAVASAAPSRTALLFTGQGSQRNGMGRDLYDAFPAFADSLDEICERFADHLARPLREVMFAAPGTSDAALLHDTRYTQPALFAFGAALYRLITSWGVTPALLAGHSIGELTAAHVAGVWSLDDAVMLVAARGRLMQDCRPGGAMISIRAAADEVAASLVGYEGRVEIAAVNGPAATVIAGDADAAERIVAGWAARGHATKRLTVSHAFHSPHMAGMLAEFRAVAEQVTYHRPTIPIVSTLTGEPANTQLCTADYWARHARGAVRFLDAARCLHAEGATAFCELGPDAVLTALLPGCLPADAAAPIAVASTRAGRPEAATLLTALAGLDTRGVDVDWRAVIGRAGTVVDLPTYPFQRRRYWLAGTAAVIPRQGAAIQGAATPSGRAEARAADEPGDPATWRYRTVWRPLADADVTAAIAAQAGATSPLGGRWPVLVPPAGVDDELLARVTWMIERLGGTPLTMPLARADRGAIAARLAERGLAENGLVGGFVSLLALDDTPNPDHPHLTTGLALTITLAQALSDLRVGAPLWAVTRGAVTTGAEDPVTQPEQAMVWGLGRTLALEAPRLWGGLIDLPTTLDDQTLLWFGTALTAPGGEDQFAPRPQGLRVPRLLRTPETDPAAAEARAGTWRPDGTVLITGGTGALGAHTARRLARDGARRVVLASRRGPDSPGARKLLDELAALGTHATIDACDVADPDRLADLLRALADAGEPVTAVVHAAGTAGPTMPLARLTLAEFADVVAGKVAGVGVLDRLLDGPDGAKVAAFVLFSSISGVWGSGNQAAYSAGNAYLDALAARRRAEGRPATAVAFGPWADAGLGAEPALREYLTRRGLRPLAPEPAVTALTRAVAAGETALTVVDVAWERFLPSITAARPSRFFEELPVAAPPAGLPGEPAPSARVGQAVPTVLGLRPPRRARALAELVQAEAAAILGYDTAEELDPTRRFLELGFDSLASVELSRRLAAASGLTLATQVVFEHPTVTELAAHLDTLAAQVTAAAHPADAAPGVVAAAPGTATTGGAAEVGVRGLYRQACAQGKFATGVGVLRAAARLRPVFDTAAEFGPPARPVRLATGPAPVALVCLPSMVAPSGPHNFARIALHLHGLRDVYALPHPGFGDGELLPANAELVIEMHADTVARAFPITPIVLAGYSSGGWLAHAIASALEDLGVRPAAVALLDTWLPTDRIPEEDIHEELRGIAVNDQAFALMTEAQITAQGAYLDLFENWRPRGVAAPVMLLRAGERMPRRTVAEDVTGHGQAWTTDWSMDHDSFDVAGDHQSMMNEHAASTARDLHRWLERLEGAR